MKVALLCPGYSSQFVGMGKELYDEFRIVQEYFEEAANCLDVNFVKLAFASSDSELRQINNAYTTIFVVSCAIISLLKERGVLFSLSAGYNVGEYAALFAANGISFPDGLYLLNKYAVLYQEALSGMDVAMLRIAKLPTEQLKALCESIATEERPVYIALYESDMVNIIAGASPAVYQVGELAREQKAKVTEAALQLGLHSESVKSVANSFKMYLEKVDFKEPIFPVLNNADAYEITTGIDARAAIISYMQRPVLWNQIMEKLHDIDLFIQVGPGSTLVTLAQEKYPDTQAIAINTKEDLVTLERMLQPTESINQLADKSQDDTEYKQES